MKPKSKSRRAFLLTAGVGGAGAAVAVATARNAESPAGVAVTSPGKDGYRETEHIQKYYKTTEV
jgi:hypothetical protein